MFPFNNEESKIPRENKKLGLPKVTELVGGGAT